jgi:esterase/lipase superfamily enzyme
MESFMSSVMVRIFYVTDRKPTGAQQPTDFYGVQRAEEGSLSFGVLGVSSPLRHKIGQLEAPSQWQGAAHESAIARSLILRNVEPMAENAFWIDVARQVASSSSRQLIAFVHGYNTSFSAASLRAAQLAFDLNFDGAMILYSWPSMGTFLGYTADEATADWTSFHLRKLLASMLSQSSGETLHLIAHSMGSRVLVSALVDLAREEIAEKQRFKRIFLVAPDIDTGVFRQRAPIIAHVAQDITIYASSADKALIASKRFHNYPRLGDSVSGPVSVPGIEIIDARARDTSLLAHSYFVDATALKHSYFASILPEIS